MTCQWLVIHTRLRRAADAIENGQIIVRGSAPADRERAGVRADLRCVGIGSKDSYHRWIGLDLRLEILNAGERPL